jgi:hypothetical protein
VYKETSGHVPLSAQARGYEARPNVLAYGRIQKRQPRKSGLNAKTPGGTIARPGVHYGVDEAVAHPAA